VASDPVLIAYGAKTGQGRKRTYWQRIGAAYPHDTGAGLTVVLDVIPRDGRIILLELGPDDDEGLLAEAQRLADIAKS
jgi:hypothetical protein